LSEDTVIQIARQAIREIGYEQDGFHWENAKIEVLLHSQSADIAQGVDASGNKDEGAGDQGIMFGYACRETPELMPAPLHYSHKILKLLADARHSGAEKGLGPDSKSQVTVRYENGKPVGVSQIVVSHQHTIEDMTSVQVREMIEPYVLKALPQGWVTKDTVWHINPTGIFEIGGPDGDSGLTGRKIIVDTYGGAAPHGGGAFSGKDPTKVDRSAAYACRYLAKNIVAAGLADRAEIQFAYAIGYPDPVSVYVNTFGTAKEGLNDAAITSAVEEVFSFKPADIVSQLKLLRPIYSKTTNYGHFGKDDKDLTWEAVDKVKALQKAVK